MAPSRRSPVGAEADQSRRGPKGDADQSRRSPKGEGGLTGIQ
jgi:hypothetical protein